MQLCYGDLALDLGGTRHRGHLVLDDDGKHLGYRHRWDVTGTCAAPGLTAAEVRARLMQPGWPLRVTGEAGRPVCEAGGGPDGPAPTKPLSADVTPAGQDLYRVRFSVEALVPEGAAAA